MTTSPSAPEPDDEERLAQKAAALLEIARGEGDPNGRVYLSIQEASERLGLREEQVLHDARAGRWPGTLRLNNGTFRVPVAALPVPDAG